MLLTYHKYVIINLQLISSADGPLDSVLKFPEAIASF